MNIAVRRPVSKFVACASALAMAVTLAGLPAAAQAVPAPPVDAAKVAAVQQAVTQAVDDVAAQLAALTPTAVPQTFTVPDGTGGWPTESSYDLRDAHPTWVTDVKSQGGWNLCHTFALTAMAESSIAKNGAVTEATQLSDLLTAHAAVGSQPITSSDSAEPLEVWSRWWGPRLETIGPSAAGFEEVPDSVSHVADFHLQSGWRFTWPDNGIIGSQTHINAIKQSIYQYGAIAIALNEPSLRHTGHMFGGIRVNHDMTLIGWDDNYPKEMLTYPNGPAPADGAFLVKNSWGENAGDRGYMWYSYYSADVAVATGWYGEVVAAGDVSGGDGYDGIYYYDTGMTVRRAVESGIGANVFVSSRTELLKAVQLQNATDRAVDFEVRIYLDPSADMPDSGSLQAIGTGGSTVLTGTLPYYGLDTVSLASPVPLQLGQRFSVVVKYTMQDGSTPEFPFEHSNGASGADAQSGQSYQKTAAGTWIDLASDRDPSYGNLTFKAITGRADHDQVTLTPMALRFERGDTEATVTVETGSTTDSWNAVSDASWLHVSKVGNALVVTADPNPSGPARWANVTVTSGAARSLLTVRQDALDDCGDTMATACVLDLSATLVTTTVNRLEGGADKDYFRIVPPVSGTWTFTPEVTAADSASGIYLLDSAGVTVKAAGSARFGASISADLTGGETYYLWIYHSWMGVGPRSYENDYTLTALPPPPYDGVPFLLAAPTPIWTTAEGYDRRIYVSSNTSWTIEADSLPDWITPDVSSGTGSGSVYLSFAPNAGDTRSGEITLVTSEGGPLATTQVTVHQAAVSALDLDRDQAVLAAIEGSATVQVTTNTSWAVTSLPDWLTASPSSGSVSGSVTLQASANGGTARTGTVTFSTTSVGANVTKTITVSQSNSGTAAVIPDPGFSNCLRDNVAFVSRVSASAVVLTVENLGALKTVSCYGSSIASIVGIGYLTGAETIDLSHNSIGDLSPLTNASLPGLRQLSMGENPFTTLPDLPGLTGLVDLAVDESEVVSIAPGAVMPTVEKLSVAYCELASLDNLVERFPNLTEARLQANNLSDISALAALNSTAIQLYYNHIADASPLQDNSRLSEATLGGQTVTLATVQAGVASPFGLVGVDGQTPTVAFYSGGGTLDATTGLVTYTSAGTHTGGFGPGSGTGFRGTFTQVATAAPAVELAVDTTSWTLGTLSATKQVAVTSNTDWKVTSNASWLGLSVTEGSGDDTVTLTAAANYTYDARTATVKFETTSGSPTVTRTVTVTQAGNEPPAAIGTVTIVGDLVPGSTVTAQVEGVNPANAQLSYEWYRHSMPVAGPSASNQYVVQAADQGTELQARVTVSAPGYASITGYSEWTHVPYPQVTIDQVTITGDPWYGGVLTAHATGVDPAGAQLSYLWFVDGAAVTGEYGSTYTVRPADDGKTVFVRVLGYANYRDEGSQDSEPILIQYREVTIGTVTIVGDLTPGSTVTAVVEGLDPADAELSYEWYRHSIPVAGPSASNQYVIQEEDRGWTLQARVTGSAPGYATITGYSEWTLVPYEPVVIGSVTITGDAWPGGTLTAEVNGVDPTNAYLTYQWFVNDQMVDGVWGSTYTVRDADNGKSVKVRVFGYASYRAEGTKDSEPVTIQLRPVTIESVTVTGVPIANRSLTASAIGLEPANADVTYQWYSNGVPIEGATARSYRVQAVDNGNILKVRVTASANLRSEGSADSDPILIRFLQLTHSIPNPMDGNAHTYTIEVSANVDWTIDTSSNFTVTRPEGQSGTVTLTIPANYGTPYSTGILFWPTDPTYRSLLQTGATISQGSLAFVKWSQNEWTSAATAQSTTIGVSSSCKSWSTTKTATWVTVTPASGTADRQVTIRTVANTTTTARTAQIYLSGCYSQDILTVTQAPAASLTISPTTWAAPVSGGSRVIAVTTNQPTWKVTIPTAAATWLSVDQTTGNADESPTLTAAAGGTARSAVVTITAGTVSRTVTVTQAAATLTVTPTVWNTTAAGEGIGHATVTTNLDRWDVTAYAPWLVVSGTSGTSGGSLAFWANAYGPNPSTSARTGTITIRAGGLTRTITINQPGQTFTITPATWAAPNKGGTSSSIKVVATYGSWEVTSSSDWITASRTYGSGGETLTLTAAPNPTGTSRSGQITIQAGSVYKSITVTQAASTLTMTPASWAAPNKGGTSSAIRVAATYGSWELTAYPAWVTPSATSGADGTTFTLTATPNPNGTLRTGPVTVTAGSLTRTFTVTQAAGTLTATPASWAAPNKGGTSSAIRVAATYGAWEVTTTFDWLTTSVTSGVDGATFTVTATPNPNSTARTGSVTLTAGSLTRTITVSQAAATLTLSRTTWSVNRAGEGVSPLVTVTTSLPDWQVTNLPDWLGVSSMGGPSGSGFTIYAKEANTTGAARSQVITVTAGNLTRTVTVTQAR
ncbi:MAG: lectin like domain-containing protein [Bifidobacteriaceae bacterium]|jgi:C1A family cysteine protease/Leucine-rich repeat (LRR) protein|nr:lectin like domain-containing protein [Bifidobacteriaceae bacterium]